MNASDRPGQHGKPPRASLRGGRAAQSGGQPERPERPASAGFIHTLTHHLARRDATRALKRTRLGPRPIAPPLHLLAFLRGPRVSGARSTALELSSGASSPRVQCWSSVLRLFGAALSSPLFRQDGHHAARQPRHGWRACAFRLPAELHGLCRCAACPKRRRHYPRLVRRAGCRRRARAACSAHGARGGRGDPEPETAGDGAHVRPSPSAAVHLFTAPGRRYIYGIGPTTAKAILVETVCDGERD